MVFDVKMEIGGDYGNLHERITQYFIPFENPHNHERQEWIYNNNFPFLFLNFDFG